MGLTSEQHAELQAVICSAFDESDFEQFLRHRLGADLRQVARQGPLPLVVFDVIRYCEHRGLVDRLLDAIDQARPDREDVREAIGRLRQGVGKSDVLFSPTGSRKKTPGRIELRVGLASESYQPIQLTLESFQQWYNAFNLHDGVRVEFSFAPFEYLSARDGFRNASAYDLVMIDDPWVPAYANFLRPLGDEPALTELLKNENRTYDDLFGGLFIKSLSQVCFYDGKLLALPVLGNVQLMIHRADAWPGREIEMNLNRPLDPEEFERAASAAESAGLTPLIYRRDCRSDQAEILCELIRFRGGRVSVVDGEVEIKRREADEAREWLAGHGESRTLRDLQSLLLADKPEVLAAIGWPGWVAEAFSDKKPLALDQIRFQRIAEQPVMGAWLFGLPKEPLHPAHRDCAMRVALALAATEHCQLRLAELGLFPVRAQLDVTRLQNRIPFWRHNYDRVRDALEAALCRPRRPTWKETEEAMDRQFRSGSFQTEPFLRVID
jgi:hypothetical protein